MTDAFVVPTVTAPAIQIVSACRCIGFMTIKTPGSELDMIPFSWQSEPGAGNCTTLQIELCQKRMSQRVVYRLQSAIELNDIGLNHSQVGTDRVSATYYLVPYWWIILPVIVISAPLLFWKPRPVKPPESRRAQ